MTGLLIMVHGSPRESANAPVHAMAQRIKESGRYHRVVVGFMECNHPSIPEAVQDLVQAGSRKIIALPYFLHTGVHVTDDLPTLLRESQTQHPEVLFCTTEYLGSSPLLAEILADRAHGPNG